MNRSIPAAIALLLCLSVTAFSREEDEKEKDSSAKLEELRQYAQEKKADVTRLRGLEFFSDVATGFYTRDELRKYLESEFEEELGRDKAMMYQKVYAHFDLIPDDLDLYEAVLVLFSSSIAGLYNQEENELFLVHPGEKADPELEALNRVLKQIYGVTSMDITLVHELTHAAQDQHYNLDTLPFDDETNDDLIMAVKSVLEGDATCVGWKYAMDDKFPLQIGMIASGYKGGALPGKAGQLPAFLRKTLTFPYGYGTDFVVKYVGNDLSKTGKIFDKFPTSSEQILHPEKYMSDTPDWPTVITYEDINKTTGTDDKILYHNVHGEFVIRILLEEWGLKGPLAREAAEGWDGDRFYVFEEEEGEVVYSVWISTWDNEKEAREFFSAANAGLRKKHGVENPDEETNTLKRWDLKGRGVLVERRGTDVLVMDGVPAEMAENRRDFLFETMKTSVLDTVVRVEKKDEEKETESPKKEEEPGSSEKEEGRREY